MDEDRGYYARRAAEEALAAKAANCDQARAAHTELARRYRELGSKDANVTSTSSARKSRSNGKHSRGAEVSQPEC